jgi:hypothetical protein
LENKKLNFERDRFQLLTARLCPSEKTSVFSGTLGILAFLFKQKKIKRNLKKCPPQTVSSTCKKSLSSMEHSIAEERRQKVRSCLPHGTLISHRSKHCKKSSLARPLLYCPILIANASLCEVTRRRWVFEAEKAENCCSFHC